MDEQVTVFLYSNPHISSFTLSSAGSALPEQRFWALSHPYSCRNAAPGGRYHFLVLKNEEQLFLMMKAVR
ncbi:MAG: hypothetical protein EPN73_16865 [Paraburkholderia sp.]|uniref:hypothetical protein n=1 Tax=Paraburkholderia sp. TaxID=1926495 RepID=UPI00122155DC|nr:hypothetical protein [Paraburkholderia sp.]TAL94485.1 MAG: hypothetical protein EPN73_16865 [Paraburkholderia sp.]